MYTEQHLAHDKSPKHYPIIRYYYYLSKIVIALKDWEILDYMVFTITVSLKFYHSDTSIILPNLYHHVDLYTETVKMIAISSLL